jgi:hypothetical protein
VWSRALNKMKYGLVSSLDLSCAFDVVNMNLLIKRLKISGLPNDSNIKKQILLFLCGW